MREYQDFHEDDRRTMIFWLKARSEELYPELTNDERKMIAAVTLAALAGFPALPEGYGDHIKRMRTIEYPGGVKGEIGTLKGLLMIASMGGNNPVPDDFAYGVWTCPLCQKHFPDDYEDRDCDNCGVILLRYHRPEEYPS